jgi:hypothetical protein
MEVWVDYRKEGEEWLEFGKVDSDFENNLDFIKRGMETIMESGVVWKMNWTKGLARGQKHKS